MLQTIKSVHLDSHESIFFSRQLEFIKSKVYEKKYPELKALRLISVTTETPAGAKYVTWRVYDAIGVAKLIANYADDLPRVDVTGEEYHATIRTLGDAYGYSIDDIKSAQYAGMPLESKKANAARMAIEQALERLAWFGDATANIPGFFYNPNVSHLLAADAVAHGTDTRWCTAAGVPTKTPDEVLQDMNNAVNQVWTATMGIHQANTMLLPLVQYAQIASRPRSTTSDTTILEFFKRTHPEITLIEPVNQCGDLVGNGHAAVIGGAVDSTSIMVVYKRDPDVVELEVPEMFNQLPAEARNLEFIINCMAKFGGAIFREPLACAIMEGI